MFLTIAATAAFVSALVFTIAPLYRFQTAGLDNLQLVLVGSVMEAAVFLSRSRPASSPTVGRASGRSSSATPGWASGSSSRPSSPTFAGVLIGQAVWGLAYTFTSGATVAWLAGELDDPDRAKC